MDNEEQTQDLSSSSRSGRTKKRGANLNKQTIIYAVAGIAIIVSIGWVLWNGVGNIIGNGFPRINKDTNQAVFLVNNQVYFGKLKNYSSEYIVLRKVFYLQQQASLNQGDDPAAPSFGLAKLGNELHGPEDEMFIPKSRILFWENMKPDSQVAQIIASQSE